MKVKRKSFTGKALAIAVSTVALALLLSTPGQASLQIGITVYDVANPGTGYSNVIVDNDPNDFDPAVGAISLGNNFTPIPGFVVQGSYHTSKLGGLSLLTSGSSTVTNGRATTTRAYVAVGDTDFTPPADFVEVTGSGTFTNAVGSSITLSYYDDPANGQGANLAFANLADFQANSWKLTPGNLVDSYSYASALLVDSFSYNSGKNALVVPDVNPYSMTLLFDFNLTASGMLTSRGQSMEKSPVPLPGAVWLLGSGLLGLLGLRSRFRR